MTGSRAVRLAVALWITLAVVVWNVIFDRVVVVAGRVYVRAAADAARNGGTYLRADDWMRPAIVHGAWTASAASVLILALGLVAIRVASRRLRAAQREGRFALPERSGSTEDGEAPGRQGARGENIDNMRDGQRRLPGCIAGGPEFGDPSR
jgi:hypothetical protein